MLQNPPTTMICVYSKFGHSRRVAEYLGNHLGITPFELTTNRYTLPVLGWIAAGRDGMRGRAVAPDQAPDLPADACVVLIGPVWAGGAAPLLNAVIDTLVKGTQDVAVLLTCGDPKEQPTPLDRIAKRLGRPLKAKMVLSNEVQDTPDGHARIEAFADALGAQVSAG